MAIGAGLGSPLGICAADISAQAAVANLAQEQLIMDPLTPDEGWWGGWVKMVFNLQVTSGVAYIITPHDIARVILMDVCQKPIRIRNGFYEYLEFGIGLQPRGCNQICAPNTMQAFERDTVYTLNDFPSTPQLLRTFPSDPADVGKRIVFQGPDQNGIEVLGLDVQTQQSVVGETDYLASPFIDSISQFSAINGIIKEPTLGPVQVFTVDPVTQAQKLLTILEPNETTAAYRRYLVNGLACKCCNTPSGTVQVSAQCKLDFVPVVSPQDYLIIQNIPAILEQAQAIRYSRMDAAQAPALEAKHHARAIALLNGQLDHYLGKINTAITVPIFGSDRLKPQPL